MVLLAVPAAEWSCLRPGPGLDFASFVRFGNVLISLPAASDRRRREAGSDESGFFGAHTDW